MRHRMGGTETRLGGNSSPILLPNQWCWWDGQYNCLMIGALMDLQREYPHWFKYEVDFALAQTHVAFGHEPAYQFEKLNILFIHQEKDHSYFETGVAKDSWGTGIRKTRKYYQDYRLKSKFVRFVDRWHRLFFPDGNFFSQPPNGRAINEPEIIAEREACGGCPDCPPLPGASPSTMRFTRFTHKYS